MGGRISGTFLRSPFGGLSNVLSIKANACSPVATFTLRGYNTEIYPLTYGNP